MIPIRKTSAILLIYVSIDERRKKIARHLELPH